MQLDTNYDNDDELSGRSKILVSKDGQKFFEIPDDPDEVEEARAKGYEAYIDVTKDGTITETIKATPDEMAYATDKGYLTLDAYKNFKGMGKPSPRPKMRPLASQMQGVADQATFDFGDELAGGAYAGAKALGGDFDLSKNYKTARDQIRGTQHAARADNPGSYFSGRIPVGVGQGAAGRVMNTLGGMTTAGAVEGYGGSESEDLAGEAEDTAIGTVAGAVAGVIPNIASAVKKGMGWAGKQAGRIMFGVLPKNTERYLNNPDAMRAAIAKGDDLPLELEQDIKDAYKAFVADPSEEARQAYISAKEAHRQAVEIGKSARTAEKFRLKETRPPEHLASQIGGAIEEKGQSLSSQSGHTYRTLDNEGVRFSAKDLAASVQEEMDGLKIAGVPPKLGPAAKAYSELSKLKSQFDALKLKDPEMSFDDAWGDIPEEQLEHFARLLRGEGKWQDMSGSDLKKLNTYIDRASKAAYARPGEEMAADTLATARQKLDRNFLKNPEAGGSETYRQQMAKIAPETDLLDRMTKTFGSEQRAIQNLRLAGQRDSPSGRIARSLLKEWDEKNGTNFLGEIDDYLAAQGTLKDPAKLQDAMGSLAESVQEDVARFNKEGAAEALRLNKEGSKTFSKIGPSSVENVIKTIGAGRGTEASSQLKALGEIVGEDFVNRAIEAGAAKNFTATRANGSRLVNTGRAIAGRVGAVAGMTADIKGGMIWKAVLDGTLAIGRYAKPFEKAYQRGPAYVTVLHETLMRTDPDYQTMVADSVRSAAQ